MMQKILIVEDDRVVRDELALFLQQQGFIVLPNQEVDQLKEEIQREHPDLILMDIHLPKHNGIQLCQEISTQFSIPILMITSQEDKLTQLMSFQAGAIDFITKPIQPYLLVARIRSIFRLLEPKTQQYSLNENFFYDAMKQEIHSTIEKQRIELTKNEHLIFTLLLEKRGEIVSRSELMDRLWDEQIFIDDNALSVNMGRLRKKLKEISLEDFIETKHGKGYFIR